MPSESYASAAADAAPAVPPRPNLGPSAPIGPDTIVQLIERAAANPTVDVDKIERLIAMHERLVERGSRGAYYTALAALQPELPIIDERGGITGKGGQVQATYAKWDDINEAIRPLLAKHGFSLSFRPGRSAKGIPSVTGVLAHQDGHSEEATMVLPADETGGKNTVQALGSTLSYGQRYTAKALLNLTSRKCDDDNAASAAGTITPKQAAEIEDLISDLAADRQKFLTYMKVESVPAIPERKYRQAIQSLKARKAN